MGQPYLVYSYHDKLYGERVIQAYEPNTDVIHTWNHMLLFIVDTEIGEISQVFKKKFLVQVYFSLCLKIQLIYNIFYYILF